MDEISILEQIRPYIPLLLPIMLIQAGLMVAALYDLANRPRTKGPKLLWICIILFVNFLGPIFYFLLGREDA